MAAYRTMRTRSIAAGTAVSLAALAVAAPAFSQDAFRIGLVALPGNEASNEASSEAGIEDLAEIKASYSAALGVAVEVMVARDYAALAEAQIEGRIDYAVYSAAAYAAAALRCGCVVPVAAPVDADGSTGLRSLLIVRSDVADGSGRLAVGPADSLATRLAPLAASEAAQTAAATGLLVETASALEAETLFLDGKVDGFFGWAPAGPDNADAAAGEDGASAGGSPARLAAAGLDPSGYRIAWRSELLRYGPHAVRGGMAAERIGQLTGLLERAGGGEVNPGRRILRGHGGFAAATADDYRAVVEAVAALGAR